MDLQANLERFKSKHPISRNHYISYHSIYKATPSLKFIFKHYCPIYHISLDEFFEYYPLLAFIEYLVYETDAEMESNQKDSSSSSQCSLWDSKKIIIRYLLKEFDLEDPTILKHIENLGQYFELESQLVTSEKITLEDVIRASELRSSDELILHCTLIAMSGKPYRDEIFEIMSPIHILLEFHDDFLSYQEDRAAGNYNTYWMFQKLYGEEAHHYLKAEIDRYSKLFEETLKRLSEQDQEFYSAKWSRLWQNVFPYFSSAELLRQTVLEGV
ncbi:MAG: hypothetical protein PX481_02350 [Microcystis sp. M53603_WE2]|jgi:hypothetical protein|uniref:hypothetical protein n=1 Tax=unclassified Microcystis TaxID=2643300 RepID=UPI0022BB5ECE|nr:MULTISPECIES: hypothetical protein [unclassified Microcystis]MCE2661414.1 hypothetical protein [Microcystis sp. 53602_E8]MCZ8362951.1 hypothetical protein [Microcystis sp. LE19-251.1A]MDJ0527847.1 hypothetical protein [Microcystis sp. M53600_WE12]MCZ8025281.1 hypothetical protein [Microcystis sp. LE19-10.1B]MDJ0537552.1 hypothetical protein [Microcystis sp. M53603_WE2]